MGFMFCDLHNSLKTPFVRGYKFVEFVLLLLLLEMHVVISSLVFPICNLVLSCQYVIPFRKVECAVCEI